MTTNPNNSNNSWSKRFEVQENSEKNMPTFQEQTLKNRNQLYIVLSQIFSQKNIVRLEDFQGFIDSLSNNEQNINDLKLKYEELTGESLNYESIRSLPISIKYVFSDNFLNLFYPNLNEWIQNIIFEIQKKILKNNIQKIPLEKYKLQEIDNLIDNCHNINDLKNLYNSLGDYWLENDQIDFLDDCVFTIEEMVDEIKDPDLYDSVKNNESLQKDFLKISAAWYLSEEINNNEKYLLQVKNLLEPIDFVDDLIWHDIMSAINKENRTDLLNKHLETLKNKGFDIDLLSDEKYLNKERKEQKAILCEANLLLLTDNQISKERKLALRKIFQNNFDFMNLPEQDKKDAMECVWDRKIDDNFKNICKKLWLHLRSDWIEWYERFLKEFFDPNKKDITIDINWQQQKIHFEKKKIYSSFNDYDDLNSASFGFDFSIRSKKDNKEFIQELVKLECIEKVQGDNEQAQEDKNLYRFTKDWIKKFLSSYLANRLSEWISLKKYIQDTQNDSDFESLDSQEELEKINQEWNELHWDKDKKFEAWAVLTFRMSDSIWKWWWCQWWYMEILQDPKPLYDWRIELKVRLYSPDSWDDYEDTFYIKSDSFKKFINEKANWIAMKFRTIQWMWDFLKYMQEINLKDYRSIKEWKDRWSDIKEVWWKLLDQNDKPIEYVGKEFDLYDSESKPHRQPLLFSVGYEDDWVIINNNEFWPKNKKMTYNAFMLFCAEKQLNPMNKDNVENLKNKFEKEPKWWFWFQMLSITSVLSAPKQFYQSYIDKWKKEMDFRWKIFAAQLTSIIPFDTALVQEIIWEKDSAIWNKISWYKSELSRDWSVHDKEIVQLIEKRVFRKNPNSYQAAWYLLYALEEWGSSYFRDLSKYRGQWKWVEAILWQPYKNEFKKREKVLIDQLEKSSGKQKENIQNEIARLELKYIVERIWDESSLKQKFGSKFGSSLDGALANAFSPSKVKENHNKFKEKTFEDLFNDFLGTMKWAQSNTQLGMLRALWEKIDDDWHYKNWYLAMLMPLLSGEYKTWDNNLRAEYFKIAWTYAFPVWAFVNDNEWARKIATIIDNIPGTSTTFSKEIWWSNDKIDFDNIWKNSKKIQEKIKPWWESNWESIIKFLNNESLDKWAIGELNKLKKEDERNLTNKQTELKKVLWDYESIIIKNAKDIPIDWDLDPNEAIPYKRAIFNMPPKLAQNYMTAYSWKDFRKKFWKGLWRIYRQKIEWIKGDTSENTFKFILSTYSSWFVDTHWTDFSNFLGCFIRSSKNFNNTSEIKKEFIMMFTKEFGVWVDNRMPPDVKNWLKVLAEYFAKNVAGRSTDNLTSILKQIFDKDEDKVWQVLEKLKNEGPEYLIEQDNRRNNIRNNMRQYWEAA